MLLHILSTLIIKEINMVNNNYQRYPHYRNVIRSKNGMVLIDTRYTFDGFLETMVFKCDEDGRVTRDEDWTELDMDRYNNVKDMMNGHQRMMDKWSK